METKHTPGPWNCMMGSSGGHVVITAENLSQGDIAVVSARGKSLGEQWANADLISASPALYEEHLQWAADFGAAIVLYLQGDLTGVERLSRAVQIVFDHGGIPMIKSAAIERAEGGTHERT